MAYITVTPAPDNGVAARLGLALRLIHRQIRRKVALAMKYVLIILALTATVFAHAAAKEITDTECASIIIQASRDAYYRTGGGCACPEGLATNGGRCGGRSAYSKPGGASPYCYPSDVPKTEIDRCKAN